VPTQVVGNQKWRGENLAKQQLYLDSAQQGRDSLFREKGMAQKRVQKKNDRRKRDGELAMLF